QFTGLAQTAATLQAIPAIGESLKHVSLSLLDAWRNDGPPIDVRLALGGVTGYLDAARALKLATEHPEFKKALRRIVTRAGLWGTPCPRIAERAYKLGIPRALLNEQREFARHLSAFLSTLAVPSRVRQIIERGGEFAIPLTAGAQLNAEQSQVFAML